MAPKGIIVAMFRATISIVGGVLPILYFLIISSTILGIGAVVFSTSYMKAPGPLKLEQSIIIESGTSINNIAAQLAQNGVIEYPQLFAIIIRFTDSAKSMQAGEYLFTPGTSPIDVFNKIVSGDVVIRKFTIAEGLTTAQIIQLINANPYFSGTVPENIPEGVLLPETYEYKYMDGRSQLVARMQADMQKTLDALWQTRQEGLPLQTKEEALVLASIVEKETGMPDERKRVAAVFVNRLKKGMRLQTDPSVIYAITEGKSALERPLTTKDLEIDSKFNTYKYAGLPPSPIANPGRASIEAALNPLVTNELYFVADGTGGHKFATTLEEHSKNVQTWRNINATKKTEEKKE